MGDTFKPPPEPATELGRYRILSSTAGIRVSPFALGALSLGDAWHDWLGETNKDTSFRLLDAYYEAGGNFVDTANNYQDEQSETWVGEWMASRKNRDFLVIATKYTTDYRSHSVGKGKTVNYSGNHKKSLHMSIRASLSKLQTDYVDILYVHWWDWTTSVKELMDSLHILVEQGKVLYLGISDTPAWIVAVANEYAVNHGKTPFSIYQGRWNVLRRDFERDIIPVAQYYGMALAPWDVLGGGQLQSVKQIEQRRQADDKPLRSTQTAKEAKMAAALEKVAREHGLANPCIIAIAYLIQKTTNVIPIVGQRTVEQLHDNIKALSVRLSSEQIMYLEDQTEFDVGFPSDFVGESPAVTGFSPRLVSLTAHIAYPDPKKPFVRQ